MHGLVFPSSWRRRRRRYRLSRRQRGVHLLEFRGRNRAEPRLHLPVLAAAGLVDLADRELDVLPGVRLIPAPGHTPGHLAVVMTSGRSGAIYLGDVITDPLLFDHPDWLTAAEAIPALSLATRKRLIERAARQHLLVAAFHLPSVGRVELTGDRTRFVPS